MIILKHFPEDMILRWHLPSTHIAKNVHFHTLDNENKHQIINLPFNVENNIIIAILPANTQFLMEPELEVEIINEKHISK